MLILELNVMYLKLFNLHWFTKVGVWNFFLDECFKPWIIYQNCYLSIYSDQPVDKFTNHFSTRLNNHRNVRNISLHQIYSLTLHLFKKSAVSRWSRSGICTNNIRSYTCTHSQTMCCGLMEVLLIECIWGVINAKHFRCDKQALGLGIKPTLFQR